MATKPTWQELSGSKNWVNLLDPLDDDLRKTILHYGEGAEAIGDAFNNENRSNARGFSRYPMENFFSSVGLDWYDYEVTQFFYASEYTEVNWIGFVAVATDKGKEKLERRDILVVWRGTARAVEALADINDKLVTASTIFGSDHDDVNVHQGWFAVYTNKIGDEYSKLSAGEQAVQEVKKQVEKYKDEEMSITVVGHSMGGALATLNAMDIAANGYNYPDGLPDKACMVTAFAFASPKVGDQKFKELYETLNKEKDLHILRIHNAIDIIPTLPPVSYEHVGQQLLVDTRKSNYLIPASKAGLVAFQIAHQLEPILHVVAGWYSFDKPFELKENIRDYGLVNKEGDALGENYQPEVAAAWLVVQNKGMVQTIDPTTGFSTWRLNDYKPPPPQY